MNIGDKVQIDNYNKLVSNALSQVYLGEHGILERQYGTYKDEMWWYVKFEKHSTLCFPESAFTVISQVPSSTTTQTIVINQKEPNQMIVSIRITKLPSVKAVEAGAVEEIVVPHTEIVARDTLSAAVMLGAKNPDVISKLKSAEIRVIANPVAGS